MQDWISVPNEPAKPMTREALDAAMVKLTEQFKKQGANVSHRCDLDGHVGTVCATRCMYCGERIRDLSPTENQLLHGEFLV